MKRSKSSRAWLDEHASDIYVKQAQAQGYRSRAVFKLLEIQEKDKILKPSQIVVDLGAAPGGWSQVAKRCVGGKGEVFALDILEMEPLPGVYFIQGDFTELAVLEQLQAAVGDKPVNVVLSDMAPNMSGLKGVDQPKSTYLAECALSFAQEVLKPGGVFLVKVFQGEGFDDFLRQMRAFFTLVKVRKPKSSRSRSRELYLLAIL